MLTRQESQ
ncbi:hypothetical protein CGLO_12270 [Colletotrichum gloeosporioides Cg-14]|uniref:Uncharacterized protein n=1 Tax=Colletotrichum gloeosporioides (strain Cg-14) TaxID=1237896 RepID=T0LJZ7_COLGC|nr:hypothetical protein CGLO_12270 [Colletotrichum gloeosporioides Cg-14]